MADIAQEAGLSVGQIYRYFQNKEAIIAAIVSQDVADMREKFAALEISGKPLVDAVIDNLPAELAQNYDPARAALRLEVIAEAARNPCVANIVRESDLEGRALKQAFLERTSPPDRTDHDLRARGEVLSMLFDGMLIRSVINPQADRQAIAEVLRPVLRHLLADMSCGSGPLSQDDG